MHISHPLTGVTHLDRSRVRAVGRDQQSISDEDLVRDLQSGDTDALAEVWRRHWAMVVNAALRRVRSEALAQEIAQDVFTTLWKQPHRVDLDRGTLVAFLRVVTRNRSVDVVRREVARARREEQVFEHPSLAIGPDDPAELVLRRELISQVRLTVEALPQREREVLELAWFAGKSYREVASMLGIPEGTAKSRIRHGLRRMSETLCDAPVLTAAG